MRVKVCGMTQIEQVGLVITIVLALAFYLRLILLQYGKSKRANAQVKQMKKGKKIEQKDYDFYDAELKKYITGDWQKASKIIHQFLSKAKHTTGDMYLLWRLKIMVAQELFDVQGKIGNMKDFELKMKTA